VLVDFAPPRWPQATNRLAAVDLTHPDP